jgi:AcrR family transcriptional regulator
MSSGSSVSKPPQRRRTQVERRAASERKLLVATAELIVERGLNNVSLVEIGYRAGYSHALVNHLFGSKAALIERLNEVVEERYQARWEQAVAERGGMDGLSAFIETYLRAVTGADAVDRVHVVLWAESIAGTPDLRPSRAAWDRSFRAGVANLVTQAAADSALVDAEAAAFVIVGLVRGAAMQLIVEPAAMSVPAAIATIKAAVSRVLSAS